MLSLLCLLPILTVQGQAAPQPVDADLLSGLAFRGLGPALTSGRIADLAVDPTRPERWFVAAASGGVWRTENAGTTWQPVFDGEGSYSIGCLALDPRSPDVIWVGTGENNSQRSVSFGDGVYQSLDGGSSWKRMGLEGSEHIGRIAIDPRDSRVVWVAAQGPLWRSGGERGLYKTSDGGASWSLVLAIDEHTGVNEVHLDPREPDVVYASAYQRQRRVWTLLNGGPGSGIHKSTDGGATWRELERGLPEVDLGRIGLAVSPADPDVLYAIVEAERDAGGVFRSTDRGENWEKRSDYMSSSPQYYNELVADPHAVDTVFALDTFLQVSEDGGQSFRRVPQEHRHVDDHALWIDPERPEHLLAGCDGGLYESFDRGASWRFFENLSLTQFYRVAVDDARPFYNVYGGTQDNNTLGAPSRTTDRAGITSGDWFVTVGGDGFEVQVDPEDPMIVYCQWQYGGLVRHDRRSGETVDIKPSTAVGEESVRWNWDSPLLLSPHAPARLYFAGSRLFRSQDRGESWSAISGDLSRGIDRDTLQVMGRVWEVDAVAKHTSTSIYGNATALSESPLVEDLLYVGTDDGLVHVSPDGGASWTRQEQFPGIPERTYVSCLAASRHDPDRVYAAFDAHKDGDFAPYLLVSRDRGASWSSVVGDLEAPHVVYCLAEDSVRPELLFAGTELGVFTSLDGGARWVRLKGGLPTIAVRDLALQERWGDLVLGTFGRGIYVLDDYAALRELALAPSLESGGRLFDVRAAVSYVERSRLGGRDGRGVQGSSFFAAANPPFGALFTYQLAEPLESRAERRRAAEKEARAAGASAPQPSAEDLRAEDDELEPAVLCVVRDSAGEVVGQVTGPSGAGLHRIAWELRAPDLDPVREQQHDLDPWDDPARGPLVPPGEYTVELVALRDGLWERLDGPEPFRVEALEQATFRAADPGAAFAFVRSAERLRGAVRGASRSLEEARSELRALRQATAATPEDDAALLERIRGLERRLDALDRTLNGDRTLASRSRPAPTSIAERIDAVVQRLRHSSAGPSPADQEAYRDAGQAFGPLLDSLRALVEGDLAALREELAAGGAPWTRGRLPRWTFEGE